MPKLSQLPSGAVTSGASMYAVVNGVSRRVVAIDVGSLGGSGEGGAGGYDYVSNESDVPVGAVVGETWFAPDTGNTYLRYDDGTNVVWLQSGAVGSIGEIGAVDSVNGAVGDVVLDADDIDDMSTIHKFADATSVDAAGAVMNAATSTAAMAFVIDEDNMVSDSATRVPTQQSVKAYVDAAAPTLGVQAINAQTGTTYTLVLADASKLVTLNNAGAIELQVPSNTTAAIAVGSYVDLEQLGNGQVTVVAGAGATLRVSGLTAKSRAQYSRFGVQKVATNTWSLFGDLAAS